MEGLLPEGVTTVSKADLEPFANGKRVGSYLFGRTIGEGSFAKVKEGLHVSTGEKVAIKIINKKKARADRYVSRNLKREAEIMQKVRHHNVVRLLEVMETDSFYYLVTELCCGGELLDLICERKHLDEDTARKYIAQLVSAVYSMHSSGVLHRDLKIENFLLDQQGDLKIVDFGLSNVLPDAGLEAWKRTGVCPLLLTTHCGSPAYAAPELLAQKPYGAQIDVWSIGINMFAMLTGNLPYNMERFNIIDMYHKMMERRMMPFPSHVSREARDLIIQLLDPVPETRITLKEAINHPWIRPAKKHLLQCGSNVKQPLVEVNQNIVLHMADNIGMSMKEVVNAVKQNRASHSFAIYFLLHEKLKRFERRRRGQVAGESSFPKVKVVKKATLKTDVNPRSKFTYKGVKIMKGTASHHSLYEKDSDGIRSDDDSDLDSPHVAETLERWNQYATFPRDRRTSCFDPADVNRLVHATLDKGSDDIDYHRLSSPETTDNSASSLESTQILRRKLKSMETCDLSMNKGRRRKESVSDEEIFARCRSKSLTGQEEYDYSCRVFSGDRRHRASTTSAFSHHLDVKTVNSSLPLKLKALFAQNIAYLKHADIFENTGGILSDCSGSDIKETVREISTDCESGSRERTVLGVVANLDNKMGESLNGRTEDKENKNGPCFSDTVVNRVLRKDLVLKLNGNDKENSHSLQNSDIISENVTEIIPPPTPFSDQELRMNIELVEPCTIRSLTYSEERQQIRRPSFNVVATDNNAKSKDSRRHQRRPAQRSKSFSEMKKYVNGCKEFKKIELEKVKRIELEPLQHTLAQVEPVLQPVYQLHLGEHDTSLYGSAMTGIITSESDMEVVSKSISNPKEFQQSIELAEKRLLDRRRGEATLNAEKRCEVNHCEKIPRQSTPNIDENFQTREFDETQLKANPFRINVVKLAKCQCMPVLRPKIFEPIISSKKIGSTETVTKSKGSSNSRYIKTESKGKVTQYEAKVGPSSRDRFVGLEKWREDDASCSDYISPDVVPTKGVTDSCRRTRRNGGSRSRSLNEVDIVRNVEHTRYSVRNERRMDFRKGR